MVPTVPAGSTWPATLPVTLPVTCPATPPSWASAGVAIAAVPAVRRIRVLRIVNLLRLTGGGGEEGSREGRVRFHRGLCGRDTRFRPMYGKDQFFTPTTGNIRNRQGFWQGDG